MPEISTIPYTHPSRIPARHADEAAERSREGERLEAPLSTVPYPAEPCRGVCLDARDAHTDDETVRYRTARW